MNKRLTYVYLDYECDEPCLVGRLWSHWRNQKKSASFEYDKSWLNFPNKFSLEPLLQLTEGVFHTGAGKELFGAIGDSAPDRWGRILMRRAVSNEAKAEGKISHALSEVDYLLMVNDESRQGALRFKGAEGGVFLSGKNSVPIPPLVELPRLLDVTEKLLNDEESSNDLKYLLAPGSSLGGARPKASVKDNRGNLLIAKFPHKNDEFKTVLWEAVALTLAKKAGINTTEWRICTIAGKKVILLKRFDRIGEKRIPFLSAMSMLNTVDNEDHSYLEIVDAIRQYGAKPKEDISQLWRRIVFSILISNTDDHLRNHAFLYENQHGWRLSPAYDINPVPVEISPRILSTAIDLDDRTASLALVLSVAKEFGLTNSEAVKIATEVGKAASTWRKVAVKIGIHKQEIDSMASAFEHEDLQLAIG